MDILFTILGLALSLVTFFIGYWTSNRQIKKEREMKSKKERFIGFYLPAMKKLLNPDMFDSIIMPEGTAPGDYPVEDYFDIVRELIDIRYMASDEVNTSLIACFRFYGDHEFFVDHFGNLIKKIENEGKQLAKDLGYSYFSPWEYGEYWELSDPLGSTKRNKNKARKCSRQRSE